MNLNNAVNKMKWRWIHRDSDDPLPKIIVKTNHTAPCWSVCALEQDVWASMLRIAVLKRSQKGYKQSEI